MFSIGVSKGKSQPVLKIKFGTLFISFNKNNTSFSISLTFPFGIFPVGLIFPIKIISSGILFENSI